MTYDSQREQLGYGGRSRGLKVQNLLRKVLAFAAAAVLAVGAIAISLVAFAVVMAAVLILGGYVWWKTREVRKQMRAHGSEGNVIEGEVITREVHVVEQHERDPRRSGRAAGE